MKARKTRWIIVCLSAAVLFGISAVRFASQGKTAGAVIYGFAVILFLLLTLAYYKGLLK